MLTYLVICNVFVPKIENGFSSANTNNQTINSNGILQGSKNTNIHYLFGKTITWRDSFEIEGKSITFDKQGNSYFTGTILTDFLVGTSDIFLGKLNSNGTLVWLNIYEVGKFSSEGPEGEFESIPDLVNIDDSHGYGAIEEITTLNQSDFVADQNFAQSYFQMEKMHNDIDLIGFEENPTHYHIRDGPIVPHSYRDPKFYEALAQAKMLVDIALSKNILYFGYVKYSADKALTSLINGVIFKNILKGSVPENFWSDFGLLSQVLEDKDVTVPIIQLGRGYDETQRKCLVPYMSFYLKIFTWVARIDVPWAICRHDPIGYRNEIAQLVYSLSSIEYSKPGTPQIVPFPIAMVDEMARIVAHNFIDISIKQFYHELGELIDNSSKK